MTASLGDGRRCATFEGDQVVREDEGTSRAEIGAHPTCGGRKLADSAMARGSAKNRHYPMPYAGPREPRLSLDSISGQQAPRGEDVDELGRFQGLRRELDPGLQRASRVARRTP